MNDDYVHFNNNIFYIEENIPGPDDNSLEFKFLLNNYNSQLESYCRCENVCSYPKCECLKRSGGNNYVVEHGELPKLKIDSKEKQNLILECNKQCTCSYQCGNRLVQLGPLKGLMIKKCDIVQKGFGLFTNVFVRNGSFICEYIGELLTKDQAFKRYHHNKTNKEMNYIFCLIEHCGTEVIETFYDPSKFGNIGRYINHSCEPNSQILPVRYDMPIPKLAIFACEDIKPGSEITYNYSLNSNNKYSELIDRKQCFCKTLSCKGYMPYDEI
ncbi:histone-lysine N-methyltransferase SETMAR [Bombyx mori]|uniref:Histone-lysine N-methyltransferase SETMAR n=1 Tax=Bombyx mori TaxID=7091 RepID=A0A8R2AHG1_BOMMO|nr:histone-lysine N-methyltransferase SETMAR [Bombyx mori]